MGVGGQHQAPAAFTPGKDPVPIVQEGGWVSEQVWIGAENLASTGIRSPDLPAHSESLYRLRHPSSMTKYKCTVNLRKHIQCGRTYPAIIFPLYVFF